VNVDVASDVFSDLIISLLIVTVLELMRGWSRTKVPLACSVPVHESQGIRVVNPQAHSIQLLVAGTPSEIDSLRGLSKNAFLELGLD
jgi:hypothetical protein